MGSRVSADVPGTWEHGDPGEPTRKGIKPSLLGYPPREHYTMSGAKILVSQDPGPEGRLLWHLSISRPNRHPSWDDIKAARYRLLPLDRDFAMFLPPPGEYVNVPEQDHVFHLWEVEDSASRATAPEDAQAHGRSD